MYQVGRDLFPAGELLYCSPVQNQLPLVSFHPLGCKAKLSHQHLMSLNSQHLNNELLKCTKTSLIFWINEGSWVPLSTAIMELLMQAWIPWLPLSTEPGESRNTGRATLQGTVGASRGNPGTALWVCAGRVLFLCLLGLIIDDDAT